MILRRPEMRCDGVARVHDGDLEVREIKLAIRGVAGGQNEEIVIGGDGGHGFAAGVFGVLARLRNHRHERVVIFDLRTEGFELSQEGASSRADVHCQTGEKAVGGGWGMEIGLASVTKDGPFPDGSGWRFSLFAESGNNLPAIGTVYAICAKVS